MKEKNDTTQLRQNAVEAMITAGILSVEQRDVVLAMDEEQFKVLSAVTAKPEVEEEAEADEKVETPKVNSLDEYLATVPAEVRDSIQESIQVNKDRRSKLITAIIGAKKGWQKDELVGMKTNQLERLAAQTCKAEEEEGEDFSGAGGLHNQAEEENADEAIPEMPAVDFTSK